MKNVTKDITYISMICLLFFGTYEIYGQNNIPSNTDIETFRKRINIVRGMQERLETSQKPQKQEIATLNIGEYEKLNILPADLGFAVFEYFNARQFLPLENKEQARIIAKKLITAEALYPEAVLLLLEMNTPNRKECIPYERQLGKILPLSTWGHLNDLADSYDPNAVQILYDSTKKGPPSIPLNDKKKFFKIADIFFELKLFDKAADAYRDAIYGFLSPPWVSNVTIEHSWLSPEAGDYWLKAAESEWELGNKITSADYLGKAGILGNENQFKDVNEFLNKLSSLRSQKKETDEPNETKLADGLKQIMQLYEEVNLHPKAIDILEKYSFIFGENKSQILKDELKEKWQVLLDRYCAMRTGKVFLFGTDILPKQNRLNIKVPKTCSAESLKEATVFIQKQQN